MTQAQNATHEIRLIEKWYQENSTRKSRSATAKLVGDARVSLGQNHFALREETHRLKLDLSPQQMRSLRRKFGMDTITYSSPLGSRGWHTRRLGREHAVVSGYGLCSNISNGQLA